MHGRSIRCTVLAVGLTTVTCWRLTPHMPPAGLHMPSRASSGALHRLSALRHLVRSQRPTTHMSARNLQRLFTYNTGAPYCELTALASCQLPQSF